MPFAGYKDFSACVTAQKKKCKSDESARKICGALQKKAEGKITEDEYRGVLTSIWLEELRSNKK